MLDTTELHAAVDRRADALRRMPESRLRRDGTAARALQTARALAEQAQRCERRWSASPDAPLRRIPEVGVFAVGDQLAVAGHDLAEALALDGTPEELRAAVERVERLG